MPVCKVWIMRNAFYDITRSLFEQRHKNIVCISIMSKYGGERSDLWWRHQMKKNAGEFPAQRPLTQSFDVFFDLRLNKRLSKQ